MKFCLIGLLFLSSAYANLITELKQFAYSHTNENQAEHQSVLQTIPIPRESFGWPNVPLQFLGQISGVSINLHGHPVLFHRGKRSWDETSFNTSFIFQHIAEGPVKDDTILTLDKNTGVIIDAWGADMFYMPHGLTIDHQGYIWVTDVALHQVFKFTPHKKTPLLKLGHSFIPGSDTHHLCMPTSTAIASNGKFFIADGYCNQRILKYNHNGQLIRVFPQRDEFLSLSIPHSLTLLEPQDTLCIADRENMRVVCIDAELRYKHNRRYEKLLSIQTPDFGRVFAITSVGELVFAVNGPTSIQIPVQGFTISPFKESILDTWAPTSVRLHNPHDITINKNGTELYIVEISPNRIWKFDTSQWINLNQYSYVPIEK